MQEQERDYLAELDALDDVPETPEPEVGLSVTARTLEQNGLFNGLEQQQAQERETERGKGIFGSFFDAVGSAVTSFRDDPGLRNIITAPIEAGIAAANTDIGRPGEATKALARGFVGLRGSLASGVEQNARTSGYDDLGDAAAQTAKSMRDLAANNVLKARIESLGKISKENWFKDTIDYALSATGEGLGSSAPFAAAGVVGGVPGVLALGYTASLGEIRDELKQSGITDEGEIAKYSYLAAIPHSILDTLTERGVMKGVTAPVKKKIRRGILRMVMGGAAKEGVTEATQRVIELAAVAHANGGEAPNEAVIASLFADVGKGVDSTILESGVRGALPGAVFGGGEFAGQEARVRTPGTQTDADPSPTAPKPDPLSRVIELDALDDAPAPAEAVVLEQAPAEGVEDSPIPATTDTPLTTAASQERLERLQQTIVGKSGEKIAPTPIDDVKFALENWRQAKDPVEFEIPSPFPYDGKVSGQVQTEAALWPRAVKTVPLDRIIVTQRSTDPGSTERYLKGETDERSTENPFAVERDGYFYVIDGHHRATVAALQGKTAISMSVASDPNIAAAVTASPESPVGQETALDEDVTEVSDTEPDTEGSSGAPAAPQLPPDIAEYIKQTNPTLARAYGLVQDEATALTGDVAVDQAVTDGVREISDAVATRAPREIVTPDASMAVQATPEIIDLADLKLAAGNLQPRDRSRAESATNIRQIAANLDPEQLLPARVSDSGAPIISADGTVVSGNGRVMALSEAYRDPALKASIDRYRGTLGAEAANMTEPVLVMRLPADMPQEDLQRFADLSNRSRIGAMSATERSIRDANSATSEVMGLYVGGSFTSPANREFFRAFTAKSVLPAERGAFSRNGVLTKEGEDRMSAAVLAAAYGDSDLISRMLESTDDNIRNVTGAMRDAAGAFIRLKEAVRTGQASEQFDITDQIAETAKRIADLRDRGIKPADFLAQQDAFTQTDPIVESLLRAFYNDELSRALSREKLTEVLIRYADEGQKHQANGLIPDETTPEDIITQVRGRVVGSADIPASLFGGNDIRASEQPRSTSNADRSSAGRSGAAEGQGTTDGGSAAESGIAKPLANNNPLTAEGALAQIGRNEVSVPTADELTRAVLDVRGAEIEDLTRSFGGDRAKALRWKSLYNQAENATGERAKRLDAERAALSAEATVDEEIVYEDEFALQDLAATYRDLEQNTAEAAQIVQRYLVNLPESTKPSEQWDSREAAAMAVMRKAGFEIAAKGLDGKAITRELLSRYSARFPDPADAAFMAEALRAAIVPKAKQELLPDIRASEVPRGGRQAPGADPYDAFRELLSGSTPLKPTAWPKQLGVSPEDMNGLVDQALQEGLLARANNGSLRRTKLAKQVAVQSSGSPVVVEGVHSTTGDFKQFSEDKIGSRDAGWLGRGFYFTPTKQAADLGKKFRHGHFYGLLPPGEEANGARNIPVRLTLRKPFVVKTTTEGKDYRGPYETLREHGWPYDDIPQDVTTATMGEKYKGLSWNETVNLPIPQERAALAVEQAKQFTDALRSAGYDGVIIEDKNGYRGEIMVLAASQIEPKFAPRPSFVIPPDVRIDRAVELRERQTGKPVPTVVSDYALRIEEVRGTPAFDSIIEEIKSDKLMKKSDVHDLAHLVGYPVPKSATKQAALETVVERHLQLLSSGIEGGTLASIARLDMSVEARKTRAEAQGFDTSKVWYHGTPQRFDAFDVKKTNSANGVPRAVYLASDPSLASHFARSTGSVLPLYVRRGKYFDFRNADDMLALEKFLSTKVATDIVPGYLGSPSTAPFIGYAARGDYGILESKVVQQWMRRHGYDGWYAAEHHDAPITLAVRDPENVRSVNAAFAPESARSPLLLASIASIDTDARTASEDIATAQSVKRTIDSLGFYSGLDEALKGFRPTDSVTAETLAKRGVKKAELEARGLSDLMADGKSAKVSALREVTAKNPVEVNEVRYAGSGERQTFDSAEDASRLIAKAVGWEGQTRLQKSDRVRGYSGFDVVAIEQPRGFLKKAKETVIGDIADLGDGRFHPHTNVSRAARAALDSVANGAAGPQRWQSFSLDPSNPTYRETVLHLPATRRMAFEEYLAAYRERFPKADAEDAEVRSYFERGVEIPGADQFKTEKPDDMFSSGHWSEPNVIAHARTSIQNDADGNKVFVVNELQSDWERNLRDGGVRDEAKIADLKHRIDEARAAYLLESETVAKELDRLKPEAALGLAPFDADWRNPSADEVVSARADRIAEYFQKLERRGDSEKIGDAVGAVGEVLTLRDELSASRQPLDLLEAELRTAEAATPGNPLVNTTDQWVNTSLKRMIRQAVEAGVDQIAIPSGETVISFGMGGKPDGLRYAYDQMYPKNLRNLLQKLDKSVEGKKIEHLFGINGQKLERSKGFTTFKITDKVRKSVTEEGLALFSMAGAKAYELRDILAAGQSDPPLTQKFEDGVPEIIERLSQELKRMLPADVAFRIQDRIIDDVGFSESFGDYNPITRLVRVAYAPFGVVDYGKASQINRHETIHALRMIDLFNPQEWELLVNHAQKVNIDDSITYDDGNGNMLPAVPLYKQVYGEKLIEVTEARLIRAGYRGAALAKAMGDYRANWLAKDLDELINQERVARMAETWTVGKVKYPSKIEALLARIKKFFEALMNVTADLGFTTADDIFQDVFSGKIAARSAKQSNGEGLTLASIGRMKSDSGVAEDGRPARDAGDTGSSGERSNLDMSKEARLSRAEALGFDTGRVLYNGSSRNPVAFDLGFSRKFHPNPSFHPNLTDAKAVWMSPSKTRAGWYADRQSRRMSKDIRAENDAKWFWQRRSEKDLNLPLPGGYVGAYYIRPGRQAVFDMTKKRNIENVGGLIRGAYDQGYDTVVLKEHQDMPEDGVYLDEIIVFNPADIRSVNAAFDPDQGTSPLLLASIGRFGSGTPVLSADTNSQSLTKPEQTLADLVKAVTKALGLTVRQGRIDPGLKRSASSRGNQVAGQFSQVTGVTRIAVPNDLATLAHEGGHSLEVRPSIKTELATLKQAHVEELASAPAQNGPAPVLNPGQGFSGLELDAETQALAQQAAEADIAWRALTASVAAAKTGGGLVKPGAYDQAAYVASQEEAATSRAALIRSLGRQTADAVIADITKAQRSDMAAWIATRYSSTGTPLPRPAITATPVELSEGFAEWFRVYVTNRREAAALAPRFFAEFESMLGEAEPDLLDTLTEIQEQVDKLTKASPIGALRSRIQSTVKPGMFHALREEIDEKGLGDTIGDKVYGFYHAFFDARHPMKRAVKFLLKTAEENLGLQLQDKDKLLVKAIDDPYKLWRLSEHSKVHATAALQNGITNARAGQVDPVGPSFWDAMVAAFGGKSRSAWSDENAELFGSYLTARRMLAEFQRFDRGELEQLPDQVISREIWNKAKDQLEKQFPDFKAAANLLYAFNRNALKLKLDNGFLTQELYDDLIQRVDYVPLNRIMDDGSPSALGGSARGNNKRRLIYKFQGSTRDFINPLESIVQDMYATQARIALNDVIRAMDRLARAAGPGGGAIAERLPANEMKGTTVDLREAIKTAARSQNISQSDKEGLLDIIDDLFDQDAAATIFRSTEINEKGELIVYLWENGKKVPIRLGEKGIPKDIFEGIVAFGQGNSNLLIDAAALGTQALRFGITKAPAYIITNFLRDNVAMPVLSEFYIPYYTGGKGLGSVAKNSAVAKRYAAFGGQSGGVDSHLIETAAKKRDVLTLRRKGFFTLPAKSLGGTAWQTLLRAPEITEAGGRVGHFEAAYNRALKDGLAPVEAAYEAAYAAHDIMDFSRKGSKMLHIARIVAFLNASLQGLDVARRTMSGERNTFKNYTEAVTPYLKGATGSPLSIAEKKALPNSTQIWIKMVGLGMIGVALAALYRDDPEYEEFDDQMRATHWFWKLPVALPDFVYSKSENGFGIVRGRGGATWIRYPKPFELAGFSNLFEAGFERAWKGNERALTQFLSSLHHTMVPPHEMNVMNMYYSWLSGVDFFTGKKVVPSELGALPPEMQFSAYTSEIGKLIGNVTNLSPAQIDQVMGAMLGTLGRDAMRASDAVLPALNEALDGALPGVAMEPRAEKSFEDQWIVSRFTRRAARGALSTRQFWNEMAQDGGKFTAAAAGYKHLRKAGDVRGARDLIEYLGDEEKAFAYLEGEFTEKEQDIHPLNRARQVLSASSGVRKEMVLGRLFKQGTVPDATHKDREPEVIVVSPTKQKIVNEILEDLSMREARNALILVHKPGWKHKKIWDTDVLWDELRAAAPEVAEEFEARLTKGKSKVYPFEGVAKVWPIARDRLIKDGGDAELSDLRSEAANP